MRSVSARSQQPQRQQPEPTEIEKLDHTIQVPGIDQAVFVNWRELRAFVAAYAKRTFQVQRILMYCVEKFPLISLGSLKHFKETESESVSARNELILEYTQDDEPPLLVPERFGSYSILFRCIHRRTDTDEESRVPDTQCPALVRLRFLVGAIAYWVDLKWRIFIRRSLGV